MIRILITDDQPLVRKALQHWLELQPGFQVVGLAADGEEALHLSEKLQPDIVLLDLEMPGMNALEALRHLQTLSAPPAVVMLTLVDSEFNLGQVQEAGAETVVKKQGAQTLVKVIEVVASCLGPQKLREREYPGPADFRYVAAPPKSPPAPA